MGSDHLPIVVHLSYTNSSNTKIINKIDHGKVIENISKLNIEYTLDIEDYITNVNSCIDNATSSVVVKDNRVPKPWWNAKLQLLWNIKRAKQTIHNKFKTVYTMLPLKRATAILKREIKISKRETWNRFYLPLDGCLQSVASH